jgi:PleD family two-component response regulator
VTVSIGLALSSDYRSCDVDEIIRKADRALYAAKAAGRNRVRTARPGGEIEKPLQEPVTLEKC